MLPSRRVTEFAVAFRRVLKRPVARYLRVRYGLGRRTAGAATAAVFVALRMLRIVHRGIDQILAPLRRSAEMARRAARLVGLRRP